jgi:hypothetical protein
MRKRQVDAWSLNATAIDFACRRVRRGTRVRACPEPVVCVCVCVCVHEIRTHAPQGYTNAHEYAYEYEYASVNACSHLQDTSPVWCTAPPSLVV